MIWITFTNAVKKRTDGVVIPRGTYTPKEDILLYALQYIYPVFLSYYVSQKTAILSNYKRITNSYETGEICAAIESKAAFKEN